MKKILFITGTRADYGKLKTLISVMDNSEKYAVYVFVCGMHLSEKFGSTYEEVLRDNYKNIHVAYGLLQSHSSSVNLGNTITYLDGYVDNIKPDMIVVHGDRIDALAGAVVGALKNVKVAHIEGGEVSGTIDESIRHAITKFSYVHFVCTEEAKKRLTQLGEEEKRIFVIGSPDIDVMMGDNLPSLEKVKERYSIEFEHYGILMYHPVTTENDILSENCKCVVDSVIDSERNYIVVFPNNDLGSDIILNEYHRFIGNPHFRVYPSLRFEYFLQLLKNSDFIIGNSSAGVRESGIYGVPAIDIGTRQNGRYIIDERSNIQHVSEDRGEILEAIGNVDSYRKQSHVFGKGNSTDRFIEIVNDEAFWNMDLQKHFVDINF